MWKKIWLLSAFTLSAPAALVRLEITERRDVLAGRSFGSTGAYEWIRGRAHFAVDPAAAANRRITDLALAPRNGQGQVEFSADVVVLRPKDLARGNRTLLLEPPNRGGIGLLAMYNRARGSGDPRTAEEFGDGHLLDQGYTLVWVGWQHDVPAREHLLRSYVPQANGVEGWVRGEYTPSSPVTRLPLADANHVPYPVSDPASLTLQVRAGLYAPRTPLGRDEWHLDGADIALAKPATPGHIYEFVYRAKNPPVAGLGLAALRDVVAEWKHGNRFGGTLRYALGVGTSQSAMALKALVYEGFNADERGRLVFDGLQPHVAGGRRATFERFTQPSRTSGPYRNASDSPTDQFPYSDADDHELATGRTDSLLTRARQAKVVPRILYTNSSYEYWGSAGSLTHTSLDGKRDLNLPATTRLYLLAGGQHGPAAFPPRRGAGEYLPNWNDYRWALRAILRDLRDWVVEGKPPPASRYPRLKDGTLVAGTPPAYRARYLDFGETYLTKGVPLRQPPQPGTSYTVLVPKPDADGNDFVGLKMPWVAVPLGAFTGWNLRTKAIGAAGGLLPQTGSYLPFSPADIRQRYASRAEYLRLVQQAAQGLVRERLLLPQDLPAMEAIAGRAWDWAIALPLQP